MSDALPLTPDQIAEQAIGAAAAGASILHLHARDPKDGRPTADPAVFMQFLPRIRQSCDAVINITTGGSINMTLDERLAAPLQASPEMCSLNMGSMNFGLFPMADRYANWKFPWEEPYLRNTDDMIFRNTFRDIATIAKKLGDDHGTKFEHECYDVGHLYTLAYCVERGLFKPPLFIQLIFGILGGIGPDMDNLIFMKRTADRLFGDKAQYSVVAPARRPGAARRRRPRIWAVTCAWDSRTASRSGRANSRRATRIKSSRFAASSKSSDSRSLHRSKRVRCSASRAPIA